jgi:signal transduction histidine kinase
LIRAKRLHLVLRIDAPKPAFLDKNLFGVVMRNLLSNAIKFSQFDGTIILEVCPISDKYLCSITDQGTGIPADILSRLFDKNRDFISSGTNAEKGIGLGLLLCREFIELMGSTIDVVSEQNKGSTFSFSVPICQ